MNILLGIIFQFKQLPIIFQVAIKSVKIAKIEIQYI